MFIDVLTHLPVGIHLLDRLLDRLTSSASTNYIRRVVPYG